MLPDHANCITAIIVLLGIAVALFILLVRSWRAADARTPPAKVDAPAAHLDTGRCGAEWQVLAGDTIRCQRRFGHSGQHRSSSETAEFIWPDETARA